MTIIVDKHGIVKDILIGKMSVVKDLTLFLRIQNEKNEGKFWQG